MKLKMRKHAAIKEAAESISIDSQPIDATENLKNQIIAAIKDEWEAISFYNTLIPILPETSMVNIIDDIIEEENVHVGQLQKILNQFDENVDKIIDGEKEAEEQLTDAESVIVQEELTAEIDQQLKDVEKLASDDPEDVENNLDQVQEEFIEETYSDDELDDMVGKVYNTQKIENIYRKKKYGEERLFAHTICVNCGRDKRVFLSNLVNDPDKYGSCICSDTNIDAKIDNIEQLYDGSKKIASNTSGYTGVSFVKTYRGEPYNKWRAYIDIDGTRTYLGDFTSKAKAIKARKEAGENGIKWYKDNKNKLMRDVRRKTKKYKNSRYRDSAKKRTSITAKKKT